MTREQLRQTLNTITPLLNEADPDWHIFGSAAAWLDGSSSCEPNDLDIMLSLDGAIRAEQLLAAYRINRQMPESGKYRSRRSFYLVNGVEIDLSGGLERLVDGRWIPVKFNIRRTV